MLEPLKVLYVASASRSGSTLLGNLLGQLPGVFNAGEMRMIWHRSLLENRPCGCGEPFDTCPVWSKVIASALGTVDRRWIVDRWEATRRLVRVRFLPKMVFPPTRSRALRRESALLDALGDLYRTAVAETGSSILVDTSKAQTFGQILMEIPGLEVYVVHLVRDSRAVAFSEMRPKVHPDTGRPMGSKGPIGAAVSWNFSNALIEALLSRPGRYIRIGYRQLVLDPAATIDSIGRLVSERNVSGALLPINDDSIDLQPTHTVFGNPDRFKVGTVRLRPDDAWRRGLKLRSRILITLLTLPYLVKYRRTL